MASGDINWSATLSASSGTVAPMYVSCMDASGFYVVATTANLAIASNLVEGVILDAGSPGNTVRVQYTGSIGRIASGLGTGAATTVGPNAAGLLVRGGTPSVGTCNTYGDVVLGVTSSNVGPAGPTGATGPAGPAPSGTGPVIVTAGVASQGPVNLAGGASFVTGVLPIANQAAPTGSGFSHQTAGVTDAASSIAISVLVPGICTFEMFGAVGDGVTNDQSACAAAVAAVNAGTYRKILMSAKTFLVTTGLAFTVAGASLTGMGSGDSVFTTTTSAPILTCTTANDAIIEGVGFTGNSTGALQGGIQLGTGGTNGADRFMVRNCAFENLGGYGASFGYGSNAMPGPVAMGCIALNCPIGFGSYTQMALVGCTANLCGIGWYNSTGNATFDGGDLSNNSIGAQIAGAGNGGHGIISNTHINHCTGQGLDFFIGANGFTVIGCHIYQSPLRFNTVTGLISFVGCVIDPSSYTYTIPCVVRYVSCAFPMGYANTDGGGGDVEFVNPRHMTTDMPAFIAARMNPAFTFSADANQSLTVSQSRAPLLDVQAGVISASRIITSLRTPAAGETITLVNRTAYTLTYKWATGTGIDVPTLQTAIIGADATNAIRLLPTGGSVGVTPIVNGGTGLSAAGGANTVLTTNGTGTALVWQKALGNNIDSAAALSIASMDTSAGIRITGTASMDTIGNYNSFTPTLWTAAGVTGITVGNTVSTTVVTLNGPTLQFALAASTSQVIITQASTTAAAGATLQLESQSTTFANAASGPLRLGSGAKQGAGLPGPVRFYLNGSGFEYMMECATVVAGNHVIALCTGGTTLTSTNMPANTGNYVVWLGNATTAPTANPVGGCIQYTDPADGKLKVRTANGVTTTLAA